MNSISNVSQIGVRNTGHEISEILNLQDEKVSSQKNNGSLRQTNPSASKIFRQFCESTDVHLDFEVDIRTFILILLSDALTDWRKQNNLCQNAKVSEALHRFV
jgi:hypothetical protein